MTNEMHSAVSRLDAMLTSRLRQRVPEPVMLKALGSSESREQQFVVTTTNGIVTLPSPYPYPEGTIVPALISGRNIIPIWLSEKTAEDAEGDAAEEGGEIL